MRKFDRVAALSVEGVSKSAIARIEGLSWNTVSRWLELAARITRSINDAKLREFDLAELQLDELNTFLGYSNQQTWLFAGIEVSSRLWPAMLVGPRTWRNTNSFIRSIADSSTWTGFPLITSDGMKFYGSAIQLTFGVGCVHAQVIKKIKQNRVVKVGTKLVIGSEWRLQDALVESEDSSKLNTAFIERLNLTIRQGSAYLHRRSPWHARKKRTLTDHLELLRFHYNFCRPHSSLKFGNLGPIATLAGMEGACSYLALGPTRNGSRRSPLLTSTQRRERDREQDRRVRPCFDEAGMGETLSSRCQGSSRHGGSTPQPPHRRALPRTPHRHEKTPPSTGGALRFPPKRGVAPRARLELATNRLTAGCSTN